MEQTWCVHGERRPRNRTCILNSPAGQSRRGDPGQVTRCLSSDKWQVKPGGAQRHIPQRHVTRTPDRSSNPLAPFFPSNPSRSPPAPLNPFSAITSPPLLRLHRKLPPPAFAPHASIILHARCTVSTVMIADFSFHCQPPL